MLYILDRERWIKEVGSFRTLLLNEQDEIVNSISEVYRCKAEYFIFKRKDKVIISFIAFVDGKRIFQPIHFFYAAFCIEEGLSDRVYADSLYDFINELKKSYRYINIGLPVEIKDIRPFLWQGFTVDNRYTYLKRTNETKYGKYMERKLLKAQDLPLRFSEERVDVAAIDINIDLLRQLKFRNSKLVKIKALLKSLSSTKYLVSFNIYQEGELIVSDILLKDEKNKKVYEILKNKIIGSDNIHSISYHHLFQFYAQAGYEIVDLMGADMRNISKFKAGFNPLLTSHFIVKYSWWHQLKKEARNAVKNAMKKLLSKI